MDFNYLINRQPVFGDQINVVAYEVRSSPIAATGGDHFPAAAERALFAMLSGPSPDQIVGAYDCFLHLTPDGMAEGLWKSTPKARVVLVFSETFQPPDSAARDCLAIREAGYRLAISEQLSSESLDLLANRAHAIHIDA